MKTGLHRISYETSTLVNVIRLPALMTWALIKMDTAMARRMTIRIIGGYVIIGFVDTMVEFAVVVDGSRAWAPMTLPCICMVVV